jgi:hypothetical protein
MLVLLHVPLYSLQPLRDSRDWVSRASPATLRQLELELGDDMEGPSDQDFINIANAGFTFFRDFESVVALYRIECYNICRFPLHFCKVRRRFAAQDVVFDYHIE